MTTWTRTRPAYSRQAVNNAGDTFVAPLASREDRELALAVINNWRSSHSVPLNTLQMNLRRGASDFDDDPTVAQRIKRLSSIRLKLDRFPDMKLARMHDIGGCRAVLSSVDNVEALTAFYKTKSRMKHRIVREDPYIAVPKPSGYRGIHLVFSYFSDKDAAWNGLKIEMQIRTRLQHAWATAVETAGAFTEQALKSSSGDASWLRFFALMSSAHALKEGTPLVPDTIENPSDLVAQVRKLASQLNVINRLETYGHAMRIVDLVSADIKDPIVLLELNTHSKQLSVRSYANPLVATEAYEALERATEGQPGMDVVLVRVETVASLRKAYPNYFLDTTAFVDSVREVIA